MAGAYYRAPSAAEVPPAAVSADPGRRPGKVGAPHLFIAGVTLPDRW